jgi:hypothetical protein
MTNDFEIKTVRKQLNALRTKHGAQSEVGSRCSTLIEQLKHYATYSGEARVKMEKKIAQTVAELASLTAVGQLTIRTPWSICLFSERQRNPILGWRFVWRDYSAHQ